jgi:methylenetetrahydrofolate dehydrogenase (NADP+)/methenyltetrahydrofolate cyclohydrolase
LASKTQQLVNQGFRVPHLVAVLVGNDGASETYVANKERACAKAGYRSTVIRKSDAISEDELLSLIESLNQDAEVDGFIVQLPLQKHIDSERVTMAISPEKDVDGFHPTNLGYMTQGKACYVPATPKGILTLLENYNIETEGKEVVVVGRSLIVGMPISILLSRNTQPGNCTVTLCHSKTLSLDSHLKRADIVIAALGKPEFIKGSMLKQGAVVIDVGITRVEDLHRTSGYRVTGDVDFNSLEGIASAATPVPGGVGPLTILSLMENTYQSAAKRLNYPV